MDVSASLPNYNGNFVFLCRANLRFYFKTLQFLLKKQQKQEKKMIFSDFCVVISYHRTTSLSPFGKNYTDVYVLKRRCSLRGLTMAAQAAMSTTSCVESWLPICL